jgi:hypothetical protein
MIGMSRTAIASVPTKPIDRRKCLTKPTTKQPEPNPHQFKVEFTSILRIRPLSKTKEKDDHVVLEKAQSQHKNVAVAVLHPLVQLTSPDNTANQKRLSHGSPNFIHDGKETDFHFHKILDTNASQESVFYATGLSIASTAMEPLKKSSAEVKSTVVIAIGNAESGKTHTIFGKISKSTGHDQEGLVPRVLESLFSQSKHHVSSKLSFGVRVTLLLVEKNDVIRDLLVEQTQAVPNRNGVRAMVANFEKSDAKDGGEGGGITIEQDPVTNDFIVDGASSQICLSSAHARDLLMLGLQRSLISRLASFGKSISRGHVMVTLQPVLITRTREVEKFGGTICMVDCSSKDNMKKASRSGQMKDSISSDSTFASLLHCFRTIKHNRNVAEGRTDALEILCDDDVSIDGSEISCVSEPKVGLRLPSLKAVPWRQSKVTMLLQPMFSATAPWLGDKNRRQSQSNPKDGTTKVTLLMHVYPGHRDYAEKRSIMNDMEILLGHELSQKIVRRVNTGLERGVRQPAIIEEKSSGEMDIDLSYSHSDDDDDFNSCLDNETPTKRQKRISMPSVPSAPIAVDVLDIADRNFSPLPPPTAPSHNLSAVVQPSAPPSASDFPGVVLPSSGRDFSGSTPGISQRKEPPSRDYIRGKLSSVVASPATTAVAKIPVAFARTAPSPANHATVATTSVIKPPGDDTTKEKSGWMSSTPVKTLASAVTVGKKHGQRALDQIEKLTRTPEVTLINNGTRNERVLTGKEIEEKGDGNQVALLQRLKELENQNARLVDRNMKLDERCEQLERDKSKLESELRDARRQGRQQEWTQQDETAWRQSRKMRLKEQDLIQGPLQQHLTRVEETYQINYKWLESGKQHFALDYPKWWKGARELNERDRALQSLNGPTDLLSPARLPQRPRLTRSLSGEKRKDEVEHSKVNIEQCKRLKKY